ncbi:unnamed protein product [Fraxinus pennsylvanica]|uniref:Uncharacterized protein n=1 Tax=Fraxinus pennsylvanica TaxID=56036 RepID=A0AAD1ZFY6_9LAMI|nr:unnamed protein product [Fraxinus pennsylvanica]
MIAAEVHYPAYDSRNFEEMNHHPRYSIPERQEESDDNSIKILDSLPSKLVACSFQMSNSTSNQSSRDTIRDHAAGTSSLKYPSFIVEMKATLTPQWEVAVSNLAMATASTAISPATFLAAAIVSPTSLSRRRIKVNYVSGLSSFSGIKANNKVVSLALPVCTEIHLLRLLGHSVNHHRVVEEVTELFLPPAAQWRRFSRLLPSFQDWFLSE